MSKEQSTSVAKAVYKLQLSLYAGIQNEDQLFAAGSLMSQGDYADVVAERSYINHCGYPLCNKKLPSERPRKGRYRISLKEHKVYDLHETYMYCSSSCLVNSRAFAGILQEQRSLVQNPAKLAEILRLFDTSGLESVEAAWKKPDLGLSNLAIQEKGDVKAVEVPPVDNTGPSNAIEGYVPRRDGKSKTSSSAIGRKAHNAKSSAEKYSFLNDLDFTSTIIISDGYSVSKSPSSLATSNSEVTDKDGEGTSGKLNVQSSSSTPSSGKIPRKMKASKSKAVKTHGMSLQDVASSSKPQTTYRVNNGGAGEASEVGEASNLGQSRLKPSIKSSRSKKLGRSVTWADENAGSSESDGLCNVRAMKDDCPDTSISEESYKGDDEDNLLLESAEACAKALSQAAEAVASGQINVADAMSEVGLTILPQANDIDQNDSADNDNTEQEDLGTIQWPGKPGIPQSDMFNPDDSLYDGPPEGFSLELSPFATMWMALFAWVTSSSLAYIYGKDDSSHEDYLSVNGREYPHKIVLVDGHSSEIKRTVEGCLSRALPAVVADLRLPIPVSTLEQGVGRLLNTMTFVDALPAFRTKQWQVVAILFMDALSICRIPSLSSHMSNRRAVVDQVLEGARIGRDEYAVMKELMMPLGRLPGFASQSGA